ECSISPGLCSTGQQPNRAGCCPATSRPTPDSLATSPATPWPGAAPADRRADVRILVVHNRYRSSGPSGENTAVDDTVELLRAAGATVHTAMISSDDIARRTRLGLVGTAARVTWSPSGSRFLAAAIANSRPDVIHVHNTFPLLSNSILWAARRDRVPVVHT